jgi:hypothetical protein
MNGGLTDADFQGCRWIENEPVPLRLGLFCCATPSEPGGAWCPRHRARVYRIVTRRPAHTPDAGQLCTESGSGPATPTSR